MENTNGKAQPAVTVEALIDGNEAAKILHIHPVTLAEMAREGRVPAIKVGRVWRYRPSSLQRWVDEQEQRQQRQFA